MQHLISEKIMGSETDSIKLSAPAVNLDMQVKPREIRPKAKRVMPSELPMSPDDDGLFEVPRIRSTIGRIPVKASLAELIKHEIEQFQFSSPVTDLVPVMIVNPVYPFRAQIREVEGEVLVEFSVNTNGRVVNPRVIEAIPKGVFDRSALKAIQGFRFRVPRVDGVSYPVSDTRLKFHFRLENSLQGVTLSRDSTQPQ
jgi:protein TonB